MEYWTLEHLNNMYKISLLLPLFILNYTVVFSQQENSINKLDIINSFPRYVNDSTWECGDSLYWVLIKEGENLIPDLINSVADSTPTDIKIPCTDYHLTKGDMAFSVLRGIISPPLFLITHTQWCTLTIGCEFNYPDGWFHYVNSNREEFHINLKKWYDENCRKMKTIKIKQKDKTQCLIDNEVEYKVVLK